MNHKISLIGAPTDIGAGTRGASMGPEALRVANITSVLQAHGLEVLDKGKLSGPSGWVRVTASPLMAASMIAPSLPGLYQRYPQLHLDISADDRVADMARDGFDIALRSGRQARIRREADGNESRRMPRHDCCLPLSRGPALGRLLPACAFAASCRENRRGRTRWSVSRRCAARSAPATGAPAPAKT